MRKLAIKLKELRMEKEISVLQLSTETGLSKSALYRWEKGETVIDADSLIVLARYFGVTTDFLLGLED